MESCAASDLRVGKLQARDEPLELIRRSIDAAKEIPGALLASGCGTDQLAAGNARQV